MPNTYRATCPLTGETRTRKTEHVYTHSVSFRLTKVLEPVEGTDVILHGTTAPKGLMLIRKTTRAHWGCACRVEAIQADKQVTKTYANVSFHATRELAEATKPPVYCTDLYRVERFVHAVEQVTK